MLVDICAALIRAEAFLTDEPLRVALLTYRGNPFCGGQGVYVRHLSRELVRLGHTVDVFSGQPYPELDDGVGLTPSAEPRPVPGARPVPDAAPQRVPRLGRRARGRPPC